MPYRRFTPIDAAHYRHWLYRKLMHQLILAHLSLASESFTPLPRCYWWDSAQLQVLGPTWLERYRYTRTIVLALQYFSLNPFISVKFAEDREFYGEEYLLLYRNQGGPCAVYPEES